MSLTGDEQDLLTLGVNTIPVCFRSLARQREECIMGAKAAGAMKTAAQNLLKQAYISTADSDTADWLALLAEDYGARRQAGEPDAVFRVRIPTVPKGVSRADLLKAAQDTVIAAGVSGTVQMVELPRDMAFLGQWVQDNWTDGAFATEFEFVPTTLPTVAFAIGQSFQITNATHSANNGTFTLTGAPTTNGAMYVNTSGVAEADSAAKWTYAGQHGTGGTFYARVFFTPATGFAFPPFFGGLSGQIQSSSINFTGCAHSGNAGTFTIIGLNGSAVMFSNASAVAGSDGTLTWRINRAGADTVNVDGYAMAFCDRGCRVWRGAKPGYNQAMSGVILILPYGATASLAKSCAEQLRRTKAAGIIGIAEYRANP